MSQQQQIYGILKSKLGLTKTLQLTVKQTAVSSFAYLSNTEISPQWGKQLLDVLEWEL
jgi:hypothetical protein